MTVRDFNQLSLYEMIRRTQNTAATNMEFAVGAIENTIEELKDDERIDRADVGGEIIARIARLNTIKRVLNDKPNMVTMTETAAHTLKQLDAAKLLIDRWLKEPASDEVHSDLWCVRDNLVNGPDDDGYKGSTQ